MVGSLIFARAVNADGGGKVRVSASNAAIVSCSCVFPLIVRDSSRSVGVVGGGSVMRSGTRSRAEVRRIEMSRVYQCHPEPNSQHATAGPVAAFEHAVQFLACVGAS